MKDKTKKEVDLTKGEVFYDEGTVKNIVVKDSDTGNSVSIRPEQMKGDSAIIASQEQWMNDLMPKLQNLADILNDGKEVDLDKHFKINPQASEDSHKPPLLDFLRKLGAKDEINFSSEQMAKLGSVDTAIHEILGHAFTEVVGEGNKLKYAGGSHDDPWQPGYKERSKPR